MIMSLNVMKVQRPQFPYSKSLKIFEGRTNGLLRLCYSFLTEPCLETDYISPLHPGGGGGKTICHPVWEVSLGAPLPGIFPAKETADGIPFVDKRGDLNVSRPGIWRGTKITNPAGKRRGDGQGKTLNALLWYDGWRIARRREAMFKSLCWT